MLSAFQSGIAGDIYSGLHVRHQFNEHFFCYHRVLFGKINAFSQVSGQVIEKTFESAGGALQLSANLSTALRLVDVRPIWRADLEPSHLGCVA